MDQGTGILLARGEHPLTLLLRLANRHGLIAGATGTGKTVTLQVLAEAFSAASQSRSWSPGPPSSASRPTGRRRR